jgi:DNA-directed RNA polymerase specialized sigma24 family protein
MDIVRITHLTPPPAPASPPVGYGGHRRALTARLNDEWDQLVADPRVRADLAAVPIAGYHDLEGLLAACGADPAVGIDDADALLARVVAAGLDGRALACRVALQRVLGALVRIAVRRTRSAPRRCAPLFDDLCSTAWLVIGSYPLARRPRAIASNICRDTEYLTCVRPERLHDSRRCVPLRERDEPVVDLSGRPDHHPSEELRWLLHDVGSSAALPEPERALLDALTAGASTTTIASELGCTDRTVRNRRDRLVGRLRELATDSAA